MSGAVIVSGVGLVWSGEVAEMVRAMDALGSLVLVKKREEGGTGRGLYGRSSIIMKRSSGQTKLGQAVLVLWTGRLCVDGVEDPHSSPCGALWISFQPFS